MPNFIAEYSVNAEATDREHVENADINAGRDLELDISPKKCRAAWPDRAERHDREADHGGDDRDGWSENVDRHGDILGDDILFEDHLGPVCEWLEETERSASIRTDPVLRIRGDLPLDEDQIRDCPLRDPDHDQDLHQDAEERQVVGWY
jgi:hypothetical protein